MIYSDQDDTLTGIIDEVRFAKSEGYEEDIYDYVDLETAFPGISECSFVDLVKDEDDEYYYFITVFRDLDDPANARSMHDIGYLQMPSRISNLHYLEAGDAAVKDEERFASEPASEDL